MDFVKFIELCNETISEIPSIERSTNDANDLIYKLSIGHVDEISGKSRRLIKHIIFESILHDTSPFPYLNILQFIFDAARHKEQDKTTPETSENKYFDNWKDLILIVLSARNKSHFFTESTISTAFNKEIEFSTSCKRLSTYGIEFEYHKGNIIIKKEPHDVILKKTHNYINNLGGTLILDYSFRMLDRTFEPIQERFQIYRKTSQGMDYITPEVPWGYIIALGAKNIHKKQTISHCNTNNEYSSFIQFMTDLVSAFEIQPYVIWESMYVDSLKVIEFFQENILYDNLISFFQIKSSYVIDIIKKISVYWGNEKIQSFDLKLDDIIKVGISIIELSKVKNISKISKSKISQKCGISPSITKDIIDKIYTSKNNNNLGFPPSSEDIDHVLTPLTPLQGMHVALPKGITSLSVLNCILNQVSKPNGIFDNAKDSSIGKFLEQFVWEQVNKSGVKCYRGDYISKDKKIKGDCDLLIKTNDYIYLFEIKKKALTRKAMSGTDFQIVKDLADSVMRSQSQCAKTEYVLLTDKKITLTVENEIETINYSNERIFKISLSLHDFGALQDMTILSTILRLSLQVNFNSNDEVVNSKLSSWKQYIDIFRDYTLKSLKLQNNKEINFKNNMFMSVPQLLTILADSHNENEFSDICKESQHMTYGTRCFYKEYSLRKALHKK